MGVRAIQLVASKFVTKIHKPQKFCKVYRSDVGTVRESSGFGNQLDVRQGVRGKVGGGG